MSSAANIGCFKSRIEMYEHIWNRDSYRC